MQAIKRYTEAQKLDRSLFFWISRMEDIYDSHKGRPDTPHGHDYYTVMLTKKASGRYLLDFAEYELRGMQVP